MDPNYTLRIAVRPSFANVSCASPLLYSLDLICLVAKSLSMKTTFVTSTENRYGSCNVTTCNGIMELLHTDQADISAHFLTPAVQRLPHITISNHMFDWPVNFAYRSDLYDTIAPQQAYFKIPFTNFTLAVIFFALLAFIILDKFTNGEKSDWLSVVGECFGHKRTRNITLVFASTFMSFIFDSCCKGQILLPIPTRKPFSTIPELADLVRSGKIRLASALPDDFNILLGTAFPDLIKLISTDPHKSLILNDSSSEYWGSELCGHHQNLVALVNQFQLKKHPPCPLQLDLLSYGNKLLVAAFRKSTFPLKEKLRDSMEKFNEKIWIERGLLPKYFMSVGKSPNYAIKDNLFKPFTEIKLFSLRYIFFGAFFALSFAVFIFILEVFCCMPCIVFFIFCCLLIIL